MSNQNPDSNTPNDTPIYDRSVSEPEYDDALDADTPRSFPGVHVPDFGTDPVSDGRDSAVVDPLGEPEPIVVESGGATLDAEPLAPALATDSSSAPTAVPVSGAPSSTGDFGSSSGSGSGSGSGKADAAKDAAGNVAGDAKSAASDVAGSAKEQASRVASEATDHAKQLLGQASEGLKEQAGQQQEKAAGGLRTISEQLSTMADASEEGIAQKVVRDLSHRAGSAASFLDGRDAGSLLDEVKSFAARKPGTFIAMAAGAGILAGRLTKALTTEIKHEHEQGDGTTGTTGTSV